MMNAADDAHSPLTAVINIIVARQTGRRKKQQGKVEAWVYALGGLADYDEKTFLSTQNKRLWVRAGYSPDILGCRGSE